MGGRFRAELGGAGTVLLLGGVYLVCANLGGLGEDDATREALSRAALTSPFLAVLAVVDVVSGSWARSEASPEDRPSFRRSMFRVALALWGLWMVWEAFPLRHLKVGDPVDFYGALPILTTDVWGGVTTIAVGLILLTGGARGLSVRRWRGALAGAGAGVLAVVLVAALTPVLARVLTVEHTVADMPSEPAPVPRDVARVGWTWAPEYPVEDVLLGPWGPVVLHADGFVALDGATGEELWTYRLPYARGVATSVIEGHGEHVHLLHTPRPGGDKEVITLDTETGDIVDEMTLPMDYLYEAAERQAGVFSETGFLDVRSEDDPRQWVGYDGDGEVHRTEAGDAPSGGARFRFGLEEALIAPDLIPGAEDEWSRTVTVASAGGEVTEEELRGIDFGVEESSGTRGRDADEEGAKHHLLAVPGAVVSHIEDIDPLAPLHGLVP
ncbi:hypothetical protein [Nocardiopsis nanhaiensis]